MKELRELIRDLRDDHDMTQKQVAAYLHVSPQCYQSYESGRCAVPVAILPDLAKLHCVSVDYLLGVDTSYLGSIDLTNIYCEDVTMYNVVYDMQRIKNNKRQELLAFMKFLIEEED